MVHDLRVLLRLSEGRASAPTATILDSRTLHSTPESGSRGGYDGAKRKKGSNVHAAVGTLGYLFALHVSPANEQDREQVGELAQAVQQATSGSAELAYVECRLHRKAADRRSGGSWHSSRGGQPPRVQTRICTTAEEVGRRTRFCVGIAFSEVG